ncbi:MAG: hypothetical protein JO188_03360 [Hyphomicrobiales bacterium]|nr:hypothetical protein [Hyphomicrobiales bacterium]
MWFGPATRRWRPIGPRRSLRSAANRKRGIICGLSGGVDSAVAAVLIHAAVGDRLTCVFVDHGLMREGEAKEMVALFREAAGDDRVGVRGVEMGVLRISGDRRKKRQSPFVSDFEVDIIRTTH